MTEMSTVQAVGHRTAKRNGTWLYRGAAAQEPAVICGSHVRIGRTSRPRQHPPAPDHLIHEVIPGSPDSAGQFTAGGLQPYWSQHSESRTRQRGGR